MNATDYDALIELCDKNRCGRIVESAIFAAARANQPVSEEIMAILQIGKQETPKQKRALPVVPYTALVLNVPFSEKDQAKADGAKWHPTKKTWYYEDGKRLPQSLEKYL